ncbi:MAG TPA: apolipoprotein N-acyltransferase [Marinagarivorans sp.]
MVDVKTASPPNNKFKSRLVNCLFDSSGLLVQRLYPVIFILAGTLLGLSFIIAELSLLAWIAFCPQVIAARLLSPSKYFLGNLLAAFSVNLIASFWLINFFIQQDMPVGWSVLLCSLYWFWLAINFALWLQLYFLLSHKVTQKSIRVTAFSLVIVGYFALTPMIFPVTLALTQSGLPSIITLTATLGELGLTAVIAAFAAWVCVYRPRLKACSTAIAMAVIGVSSLNLTMPAPASANGKVLALGWVQVAAPVRGENKLERMAAINPLELQLSRKIADRADVVVWPETGRDRFLANSQFLQELSFTAKSMQASFVIQGLSGDQRARFNTLAHLAPEGDTQIYYKRKLVPFGEFTPRPLADSAFERYLLAGEPLRAGTQNVTFASGDFRWRSRICFEVLFNKLISEGRDRVDFITISSNQAWFQSDVQMQLVKTVTRLRAIQSGLPVLHVNNQGPSWLFNGRGELIAQSPKGEGAFLATIQLTR